MHRNIPAGPLHSTLAIARPRLQNSEKIVRTRVRIAVCAVSRHKFSSGCGVAPRRRECSGPRDSLRSSPSRDMKNGVPSSRPDALVQLQKIGTVWFSVTHVLLGEALRFGQSFMIRGCGTIRTRRAARPGLRRPCSYPHRHGAGRGSRDCAYA